MGAVMACPSCGRKFAWRAELGGRRMKCKCGVIIEIPTADQMSARDAPAPVAQRQHAGGAPARPVATAQRPAARAAVAVPSRPRPAPAPVDDAPDLDALASLGGGEEIPVADAPAYRPTPAKRGRASAAPRVPVDDVSWGTAIAAAIFSRDKGAATWRQHVAQFWIFSTLLIGVGVAAILFCYAREEKQGEFMSKAKKVQATVFLNPTVKEVGNKYSKLTEDNYEFTFPAYFKVDGQEYKEEVRLRGGNLPDGLTRATADHWQGKPVDVYYDPADPHKVQAAADAQAKSWFWGYVIGLMFLGTGLYAGVRAWPYGGARPMY